MKSNKTISILLLVLLVMLGLWLVRDYVLPKSAKAPTYLTQLPAIKPDAVDHVTLQKGVATVALAKEGAEWKAEQLLADKASVEALIKGLLAPTTMNEIALTNARHEQLGVASGSATLVKIASGTDTAAFLIGVDNPDGAYVRLPSSDAVYQVKGLPSIASSVEMNDWIDKTLTKIDETAIKSIAVARTPGATVTLNRTGDDWFEANKQTALDKEPLSTMLTTLAAFSTQGLIKEETTLPKQPTYTVVVNTDAGEIKLSFYKAGETYAVSKQGRGGMFTIGKGTYDAFNLTPAALKPKPPATPTISPAP